MNPLHFRRAIQDDLAAIIDLLADDELGDTREHPGTPIDRRYQHAFTAIGNDSNQLLAVCLMDDQIIGCLQLSFIPGLSRTGQWRGQIESVRIASTHRGDGIGRQMFEWAIDQCRAKNCGLVQLTTDSSRADAARFYQSLGFQATHTGMKLNLN